MRKGTCSECGHRGSPRSIYCAYCGERVPGWFGRLWQEAFFPKRLGARMRAARFREGFPQLESAVRRLGRLTVRAGETIHTGMAVAFKGSDPANVIGLAMHVSDANYSARVHEAKQKIARLEIEMLRKQPNGKT